MLTAMITYTSENVSLIPLAVNVLSGHTVSEGQFMYKVQTLCPLQTCLGCLCACVSFSSDWQAVWIAENAHSQRRAAC